MGVLLLLIVGGLVISALKNLDAAPGRHQPLEYEHCRPVLRQRILYFGTAGVGMAVLCCPIGSCRAFCLRPCWATEIISTWCRFWLIWAFWRPLVVPTFAVLLRPPRKPANLLPASHSRNSLVSLHKTGVYSLGALRRGILTHGCCCHSCCRARHPNEIKSAEGTAFGRGYLHG